MGYAGEHMAFAMMYFAFYVLWLLALAVLCSALSFYATHTAGGLSVPMAAFLALVSSS